MSEILDKMKNVFYLCTRNQGTMITKRDRGVEQW